MLFSRFSPRFLLLLCLFSLLAAPALVQAAPVVSDSVTQQKGKGKKGQPIPRPRPKPGPQEGGDDD